MAEQKPDSQTEAKAPEGAEKTTSSSGVTLQMGLGGILGVKAGMTQIYNEKGDAVAVTVVDVRPSVITQVKTKEKDGYQAIQVGFLDKKSGNKPEMGRNKKGPHRAYYHYQEFRLPDDASLEGLEVGKTLTPEFLKDGDLVDVSAVSKGKGFQGVMKRHNFAGGPASHGASIVHRMPGSIGNRSDPSKVFKGKKMAGHMGHKKVTIQNVKVVKADSEKNLILLHGSVPGPKSGIVTVFRAVKHHGGVGAQKS